MRLTLTLQCDQPIFEIPVNYNHLVQAALYRNLSPDFADFLHNQGFMVNNRRFALFVFSRLMGKSEFVPQNKTIRFQNPVRLAIASPVEPFVHDTAQLLMKEGLQVGPILLRATALDMQLVQIDQPEIVVETLSPVVAYSTLLRPDGRKYTVYFNPTESDFIRIVSENLIRKGRLMFGENSVFQPLVIRTLGRSRKQIVMYKNTIIEAYSGQFVLQGDNRLLQTALEAGLGSKNSAGFGMIRQRL